VKEARKSVKITTASSKNIHEIETPGCDVTEDTAAFSHEYFDLSINVLDLLLLCKP